jgi:hypothetical protein
MTGFSFAHGSVADLTSPSGIPVTLMAMNKPATSAAASDSALRSAIVKAARYYLSLAQNQSPSAMEALIWQNDSTDGVDHGESCAAFASLTLESGAQATGQQSWVSGGSTYPWPVHSWVDSRVDPNPASLGVMSILQDAQAHQRWHPIGDGYTPQPGDWVMFDGHVEVVTKYAEGVLYTIGGDSMPNLSVNSHQYDGPLAAQGVTGFVNNGVLLSAVSQTSEGAQNQSAADDVPTFAAQGQAEQGQADVPGIAGASPASAARRSLAGGGSGQAGSAAVRHGTAATATIPGAVLTGSVTSHLGRAERGTAGHPRGVTRRPRIRRRSRPSSPRSRQARWPRNGSTASRRRSRSRRRSTSRAGARACSPARTTTCSGSRGPARRVRSCGPRRRIRTARR